MKLCTTLLKAVTSTLKAFQALEEAQTDGIRTVKANTKITLKKIDTFFLINVLQKVEAWTKDIATDARELDSTGNKEHDDHMQKLNRYWHAKDDSAFGSCQATECSIF